MKVLGYTRLAEKPDIFVQKYPDVDSRSQYFGDVSIIAALGIMNGDGIRFRPNDNMTLAEAVVVISRLMTQVPSVMYR